jgi:hypothetical protein
MLKIGPCDVTVGPHLFDAVIYVVKDPNAPPSLQYAPPQRPSVQWGVPHTVYRPYGSPSNAQRPTQYSPAPAGRPGYPGSQPSPQQPHGPNTGNAPSPQGGQRPAQGQKGPNGQPAKPSPDPVIQMLATRAAADPELKALMRVVASSQASQEQLRAFQAHIDELNAIIKSREQQEQRQKSAAGTPTPASQTQSTPQPPQKQDSEAKPASQTSKAPIATGSVNVKEEPTATGTAASQPTPSEPARPAVVPSHSATPGPASTPLPASTPGPQQSPAVQPLPPAGAQQLGPRPGPPFTPYQQPSYGLQAPLQSRPPQYGTPSSYPRPPTIPIAPPRVSYSAVVFEFTSPLTPYGSSTSGHAGSGDRYLFPEHTILEWLPAENTVIASFLVVRKVDPNTPFPLEVPTEGASKSKSKGKGASKAKGDKKVKAEKGQQPNESPAPNQPVAPTDTPQKQEPIDPATPGLPSTPSEANLKEYWQPVTFRIHAPNAKILEPLARVVKPADEVRKYMNEIMDRAERSPDGYLALQLPREEAHEPFEAEGTPASSGAGTRSRLSRVQHAEESEVETTGFEFEEEEEEDLKDFYDAPSGLPPMVV